MCSEAFEYSALTETSALCTDLSVPAGCSQNTESQRETVYHIMKCVCVRVLPGTLCKIEDFVLIVNVALYPKYKMFSNKVEI